MDILELDLLEALGMAVAGIDVADGAADLLEALGHAAGSLALLGTLGPIDGLAHQRRRPLRGTGGVEVLRVEDMGREKRIEQPILSKREGVCDVLVLETHPNTQQISQPLALAQ